MAALAMAPHHETIGGARSRQVACGAHRVEHGAPLAHADQIGMNLAPHAESGIVGGDHDVALRQHLGQSPNHAGTSGISEGAQVSTTPLVGWAHAITSRPRSGAGPGGMKTAPETAIGSPFSPVER